jgi:hypothetical protein
MTRYGEVKPYFSLHFSVEAEFSIVPTMLAIIATPGATKSFKKFLRCPLNGLEAIW